MTKFSYVTKEDKVCALANEDLILREEPQQWSKTAFVRECSTHTRMDKVFVPLNKHENRVSSHRSVSFFPEVR